VDSLSYIAPHGGGGAVAAVRPISVPTAPVPVPELPVDLWSDHHRPPTPQAPAGPTGPSRSSARRSRWVIEWVTVLLIAIVLAVGVRTYVAQMFYIPSGSMLPTLQVGDRIVVDKLSYHLHGVGRGDVVVFRRPPLEQAAYADLVKRVIGLPGDTIGVVDGRVTVDGDPRMRERPLGPLLTALRTLGAQLPAEVGHVPFTMRATGRLQGGTIEVDASSSSQLISGLLLAAPRYDTGLVVSAAGGHVPSAPHLAMTVGMLREAGGLVDDTSAALWRVEAGPLRPTTFVIEPDLSSASAFLAAAAVTGGRVRLAGWPAATQQPGRLLPALMEAFGCTCTVTAEGELEVTGPTQLNGADLDLSAYGEAVPTLTAMALFADSPTRLRGIAHLRGQETDRLAALSEEFGRLGARITVTEDGLAIAPCALRAAVGGAVLDPRADHRLAMAYAVAGLRVDGVRIADIATTGKTVPDFPRLWSDLLAPAATLR